MISTPDATNIPDAQALADQMQEALEPVFELALNHHQAGQHKEAEDLYRTVLEFQPEHPDAHHNLGVLVLEHQPAVALEHFRRALVGDTEREQFWLSYLEALLLVGEVDVARQMLTLGLESGLKGGATDSLVSRMGGQDAFMAPTPTLKKKYAKQNITTSPGEIAGQQRNTQS